MKLSPELIKNYITRRETDLIECTHALEIKDFQTLLRIGHKLKGNALMYGYPELGELGAKIEEYASQQNIEELGHQVEQYRRIVDIILKTPNL